MIKAFINQTRSLISRSDISLIIPSSIPVENNEDGTRTHNIYLSDHYNSAQISNNFILNVLMFFSMLDAYVDNKYPALVGGNFARKLRRMPKVSISEIVLREVYRIYKVIRNATIHNAGSIDIDEKGNIFIQYRFNDTKYDLEITPKGLQLLNSITFEFISPFESRSTKYSDALRVSLLTDLRKEIKKFNDENNSLDHVISNNLSFKYGRRYRPQPVRIDWSGNKLTIQNPHELHPIEASFSGVDYEIINGDNKYLVPSEALINNSISLEQLSVWKLS
ncbi:hypothetical protein [Paenibacillus sp. SN-8-1]|uniref:hypothetical protein n=1 Tax=Paenibacillus sp. SN-8-1 TaxID=3435409 RepID=UPI003D9A344C